MVPYMLGRLVTAVAPISEVQTFVATPLLALGYFWGWVSYSNKPVRDVLGLMSFIGICIIAMLCGQQKYPTMWPDGVAMDFVQLPACTVAVFFSWMALWRNKAWLWFFGLLWGLAGPVVISMVGQDPYQALDPKLLSDPLLRAAGVPLTGPILWYSDQLITLPLVFAGIIQVALEGRPERQGADVAHNQSKK